MKIDMPNLTPQKKRDRSQSPAKKHKLRHKSGDKKGHHSNKNAPMATSDGYQSSTLFVFQSYNWKDMKVASGVRKSFHSLQNSFNRRKNDDFYKNNSCTLSPCDSSLWFNIIYHDDHEKYDQIVPLLNDEEKDLLINGSFWYDLYYRQKCVERRLHIGLTFHFPIILASCYRATNCLKRILNDGADPEQTDQNGYNLFHVLALAAAASPQMEQHYMEIMKLLIRLIPTNVRQRMVRTEDTDKFLPLELAAKLGVYGIFRLLLNMDDAYIRVLSKTGIHHHVVYDVTEYENLHSKSRYLRSPLRYIARMKTSHLASFVDNRIIDLSIIKAWLHFKQKRTWPYVFFWCVLRALFLLLLIALDVLVEKLNEFGKWLGSLENVGDWLFLTVAIMSAILAISHVSEWIWHAVAPERQLSQKRLLPLKSEESHLAYTLMYRILSFCQCILVISLYLLRFVAKEISLYMFLKPFLLLLCLLNYLELLEVVPFFESFAVVLQKTVPLTFRYVSVQFIVKIIFAVHFYDVCHTISRPPEFACIPDGFLYSDIVNGTHMSFQSVKQSIYDMVASDQSAVHFGTDPPSDVALTRVLYYSISIVMLLSYVVAIMTTLVNTYWRHGKLIARLRQLELMFLAEDRMAFAIRKLDAKSYPHLILATLTADEAKIFT